MSQPRIIELQKALTIARRALERIQCGHRDPEGLATQALDGMWKLEPKQQLQTLVGHAAPKRS